ncbi:MAG: DUF4838 domain-containing protein [Armatimonadota bacterium]
MSTIESGTTTAIALVIASLICASTAASAERALVRDGQATSAIVLGDAESEFARRAADELRYHVQRATGVALPVIERHEIDTLPADHTIVVVGADELADSLGVSASELRAEEFRIRTQGRYLVFAGHDLPRCGTRGGVSRVLDSPATVWAVDHFLDRHMGVRWLWPGDLGTFVPRADTIAVPDMDVTHRPAMAARLLRVNLFQARRGLGHVGDIDEFWADATAARLYHEANAWKSRHQMGARRDIYVAHSFRDWWERFHETRPEIFATLPGERSQPWPSPDRVKLCVSNPAVDELVLADWREAGRPDLWSIGPNDDGRGLCVCEDCRAMDAPRSDDVEAICMGHTDLSARYLRFWNRVLGKMRAENPDVRLVTLGYVYTREGPPPGVGLEHDGGLTVNFVHGFGQSARAAFARWLDAGVELVLRPNWWHTGAVAPWLPLHQAGEYFRFAQSRGITGFDFDTLLGYWGTQGPFYYLIARLSARPELSVDEVIAEYASAFGAAAPVIREYLDFWESASERVGYPIMAGRGIPQRPGGFYDRMAAEHGFETSPIVGSWPIIPLFYDDALMSRAHGLLDEAERAASEDEAALARIEFLRDGLRHLTATRDVLELGYEFTRPDDATLQDFEQRVERLQIKRRLLNPRHVIWADTVNYVEQRRDIPTSVERLSMPFAVGEQLEGIWKFQWDPDGVGEYRGWFREDHADADWPRTEVTAPWEELPVGKQWRDEHGHDYNGLAWYRTRFTVPADAKGERVRLIFGAVDEACIVWVNGEKVHDRPYPFEGDTNSWKKAFEVDITDVVRVGEENLLAVRVEDNTGAGGIWRPVRLCIGTEAAP